MNNTNKTASAAARSATPTPITAVFCQIKTIEGEYIPVFNNMGVYLPIYEKTVEALVAAAKKEGLERFTLQLIDKEGGRSRILCSDGELSAELPGWSLEEQEEWEVYFLLRRPTASEMEEQEKAQEARRLQHQARVAEIQAIQAGKPA